ncbi:MAG: type VI secretion system baseplate subunit TssK [Planctomycetota bacterium]|nr:type VI secretion system baseplate subunit TssK [Planctomycetota bacterium]
MHNNVHWEEGLFLRQQHLQMLDRAVNAQLVRRQSWGWSYPYGIISAEMAREELANGWIAFRRLTAVTREGVLVSYPDAAELPRLNIEQVLAESGGAGVTVYLGVPTYDPERANATERGKADALRHWVVEELEDVPDENRGRDGGPATPVRIRRVNARLLAAKSGVLPNSPGLETLPLLRVERTGTGEGVGAPRLDETFIPPCQVVQGSPLLLAMLQRICNQIESTWQQTAATVVPSGGKVDSLKGSQMVRLLRAQSLSRCGATLLPRLGTASSLPPIEMYLELRALVAEYGVLQGESAPLASIADYDHDNPYVSFHSLEERLNRYFADEDEGTWERVPFEAGDGGAPVAKLTSEHFAAGVQFFLGIKSNEDPRVLAGEVEDENSFRLLALSMRRGGRFFGVKLQKAWEPPPQFPGGADKHYFELRLDESKLVWDRVVQDGGVMLDSSLADMTAENMAIYITLPG